MARDSQAALVALNRFGLGARGGASGDVVTAASDPRGFVKAELSQPNRVLLDMPGLSSTPDLAQQVFAYQFQRRQERTAARPGAPMPPPGVNPAPSADAQAKQQKPSLDRMAMEISPKQSGTEAVKEPADNANAAMMSPDAMAPETAKPPPQLNIIQKTYRAEALV